MSKDLPSLPASLTIQPTDLMLFDRGGNPRGITAGNMIASLGIRTSATDDHGVVHVNNFYPAGVGPGRVNSVVSKTPASLGYTIGTYGSEAAAIAAYINACTKAPNLTCFTSFNSTTDYGTSTYPATTDECDAIAMQAASNYIYDRDILVIPGYNESSGEIVLEGIYVVNKPIILNHAGVHIHGTGTNAPYFGTAIHYNGPGGTIDYPKYIFDLYVYDEFAWAHGRNTNATGGIYAIIERIAFCGKAGAMTSPNQNISDYISGIRFRFCANVLVKYCSFYNTLYDGIVVTAPSLFVEFSHNFFYGCHRDGVAVHGYAGNFTTTVWFNNNEFGYEGRYAIFLNLSGAIEANCSIKENSFEGVDPAIYYYQNPEWWVHGIRATICVMSGQNTIFEDNFYEGITGPGSCDVIAHLVDGDANFKADGAAASLYLTSNDTDQARSNAAIAYQGPAKHVTIDGAIPGITKANPGVVHVVAHGYSNGDVVHFYQMHGMSQVNGPPFTVTVIDADHFSIGVDTTGYATWTEGPAQNWCLKGQRFLDITNARNYRIGYRGKTGLVPQVTIDGGSIVVSKIFYPDDLVSTENPSLISNINITPYAIPTMDAVGRDGRKATPLDAGARPTRKKFEDGKFSLRSVISGQKNYGDLICHSFGVFGNYVINANGGPPLWVLGTPYAATFTQNYFFGDNTHVQPTTYNGFDYECKIPGTSAGAEPTWATVIATHIPVTAISNATLCNVTAVGHGLSNGQSVVMEGIRGMTNVNYVMYTITVVDADNFTIGVNSTAYATFVAGGGIVYRVTPDNGIAWKCVSRVFKPDASDHNIWEMVEMGHRIRYAAAAPTAGYYAVSDKVWNISPTAGGTPGWVCTTGGLTGTFVFKPMASLGA